MSWYVFVTWKVSSCEFPSLVWQQHNLQGVCIHRESKEKLIEEEVLTVEPLEVNSFRKPGLGKICSYFSKVHLGSSET